MRRSFTCLLTVFALPACGHSKNKASDEEMGPVGPNDPHYDDVSRCADPKLVWKTGAKTMYESYPAPGSRECIEFSGCDYVGLFSACPDKKSETWVAAHNIVAVFPDFQNLQLHDLCLRQGNKVIVATVYDECADSDCDGCCTEHQRDRQQLIDVEKYTEARWGVLTDSDVEWADLGPTRSGACLGK